MYVLHVHVYIVCLCLFVFHVHVYIIFSCLFDFHILVYIMCLCLYMAVNLYTSRGWELEPQLGQHSSRRLTKVTVTSVIRIPPMGLQSMWRSSQLLGNGNIVWSTSVRKPGNTCVCELVAVIRLNTF